MSWQDHWLSMDTVRGKLIIKLAALAGKGTNSGDFSANFCLGEFSARNAPLVTFLMNVKHSF